MSKAHYRRLFFMIALSFVSMYALMYAMVDRFENVYGNLNQVYMAGLMTAPMVILELALMGEMYHNKTLNKVIMGVSLVALVGFWMLIRQQTAITNTQFLRSMIPHHAGAILMCEKAPLDNPQVQELCRKIISGQQAEIRQMKSLLNDQRAPTN